MMVSALWSFDKGESLNILEPPAKTGDGTKRQDEKRSQAPTPKSFVLIDSHEFLKVSSLERFMTKLNCTDDKRRVKVVSIFGNTGDGKSHTMNETFFGGRETFQTCNDQSTCTMGVWAAFDPELDVICLDTEGILGIDYEKERVRMLLKVLAISDIVIYRTRSEKLNRDLFTFLGTASQAYSFHFQSALETIARSEGFLGSLSKFGPSLVIAHETRHTKPLSDSKTETAEEQLRAKFAQMGFDVEAFNSVRYVGFQTVHPPTDFELLRRVIRTEIENVDVRTPRRICHVYNTLKRVNDKFSERIKDAKSVEFPDQYFRCPVKCLSCDGKCARTMGHTRDGEPHRAGHACRFDAGYENRKYLCKRCHASGHRVKVTSRILGENDSSLYGLALYAWSGYVIDCPNCGEIYRSRQYWFGNKNPEDEAVLEEVVHVWQAPNSSLMTANTAQRVVDGVSYLTEAVASASLQPTKVLSDWVTDQIAPAYWRPNSAITKCHKCRLVFGITDKKHHCRDCGEGFCSYCSSGKRRVPHRNWFAPVRVCDACYARKPDRDDSLENNDGVSARKVTEQVVSTLSVVGSVLNYSKSFIKDSVRPSYWVPDAEITNCCTCERPFSDILTLHHCRDCGRGVCNDCSRNRKPVPHRGWDCPVRVCDACSRVG